MAARKQGPTLSKIRRQQKLESAIRKARKNTGSSLIEQAFRNAR